MKWWSDGNQEAYRQGEKDAERGYRGRHDYDSYGERASAYDDGYQTEERRLDRIQEERQEQEDDERRQEEQRQRDTEYRREQEEMEYYQQQEQQQEQSEDREQDA